MYLKQFKRHYGPLITLGVPIVIGQLGMILVSLADTMMVGNYGTPELGASGFVNNMMNLAIVFATGYSYGLTPIVGNLFGKGDAPGIGRSLKNSLLTNSLMAMLLMAAMGVLYINIGRLGQPEELIPLIRPYYLDRKSVV